MVSRTRFFIGSVLAGCGYLCGCTGVTQARIGVEANPLGAYVQVNFAAGPATQLSTDALPVYTIPAAGQAVVLSSRGPATMPAAQSPTLTAEAPRPQ